VYADLWTRARLRQGDVIGPLVLPVVDKTLSFIGAASSLTQPAAEQDLVQLISRGESRFVVVVSHDCEFNEAKRNKLLVARLQDVPGNLSPEERQRLRESNDFEAVLQADPDKTVAGVDSFVLSPLPPWFEAEQVVNFATVTALPMSMQADLLAVKRAEMLHTTRVLFRKKLAWFFGRKGDDLPDEDKVPRSPET